MPELQQWTDEAAFQDHHEDLFKIPSDLQYLLHASARDGSAESREGVHAHEVQQRALRPRTEWQR